MSSMSRIHWSTGSGFTSSIIIRCCISGFSACPSLAALLVSPVEVPLVSLPEAPLVSMTPVATLIVAVLRFPSSFVGLHHSD